MTEDAGSINRTTLTQGYTDWGKADVVQDSAGHVFLAAYDADGNVQAVTRTDVNPNIPIATFSYGTSGISNGLPTSITDDLSGVRDKVTYQPPGPGIGQVSAASEYSGPNQATFVYGVAYGYDANANRSQTTYSTNYETRVLSYRDYILVGPPEKGTMAFQTLTQCISEDVSTAEEVHYAFDSSGRLQVAAFAQTPAAGFTPTSGNPYYDSTHLASYRARAFYDYDAGGRTRGVYQWWDTYGSGGYTSEAVLGNTCQYEIAAAPNRCLKSSSTFLKNTSRGSATWTTDHTESYSYDPQLDYLTGANYGDGLPNATPAWTYDAAGNRYNGTNNNPACAFDNLNRPTELLGHTCTSDILGNRLTCGSQSYGWDALNRMTSYGTTSSYVYRADGMRVSKAVGSTTTTYAYDGQMGMEDVDTTAGISTVTDYGLGARGVDYISSTKSGTTTVGFPIYDAHGNMTACLFRSGSTYYSLGNQRHYDAWGQIRSGAISGDPKGRYCASLGHKQDDESGLVYMRARYYEPSSGRFVSEDTSREGFNWFTFCSNNPIKYVDESGSEETSDALIALAIVMMAAMTVAKYALKCIGPVILAASFINYCYTELTAAGATNASANEQTVATLAGTLVFGGCGTAAGRFFATALGNVLQTSLNSLGFFGNSAYFTLLGSACVSMAVYSIVLCSELIMDSAG